jgi:hypothetical protein
VNAKTSTVTRPSARPAAPRATPRRLTWPLARWDWAIRIPPATIITALSTDRVVTSRTLRAVAVSEGTA